MATPTHWPRPIRSAFVATPRLPQASRLAEGNGASTGPLFIERNSHFDGRRSIGLPDVPGKMLADHGVESSMRYCPTCHSAVAVYIPGRPWYNGRMYEM